MRWHALSAVVGLFAAGLVAGSHVRRGLQLGRHRASGLFMCVAGTIVVVTGYALGYLVPESWHLGLGLGHTGLGTIAFGVGVLHWRTPRRC
jgi:hypothetical protein